MTDLDLARRGDRHAFDALVAPHRAELLVHCYRMLGSLEDAEDVVQETLLAAWNAVQDFEGRSTVRTWLYRIATNRCLNHRRTTSRRPQGVLPSGAPAPTRLGEFAWLQPFPDSVLESIEDPRPGPESTYESREAVTLAFVTAMQELPPRQRAVLLLRDVLGYPAREVAHMLGISLDSANNALKRAPRHAEAVGEPRPAAESSAADDALVARFVEAFVAFDVDAMVELMSEDVWLRMPPAPFEFRGRDAALQFFRAVGVGRRPTALVVPTRANGHHAWGDYGYGDAPGELRLVAIEVATVRDGLLTELTRFPPDVAEWFHLPRTLQR